MGRKIVICFDGTSNEFGKVDTNVIRLVEVADRDQLAQRVYYDPGVGTLPEPGSGRGPWGRLSEMMGLAFGAGLLWKVSEAYVYLMETWEPTDDVFIFGFSRGAYSARVFAAMLHAFGLLSRGNDNLVPYMLRLFRGARKEQKKQDGIGPWMKLCDDFRWTFARQIVEGDQERHFPVHFVGVWDTVSSLGAVWTPTTFPYTANNPSIRVIRHAVAIDERRSFFWQNLFHKGENQDFKERWFAGSHCDVGGGYREIEPSKLTDKGQTRYAGTWRCAFLWLLNEATDHGFLVNKERLRIVLERKPECASPWTEAIHDSLVWPWTPLEFVPKWVWSPQSKASHLRCGFGRRREIPAGAFIHQSALNRIRETNYNPSNLSKEFRDKIKGLSQPPDEDIVYEL